MALTIAQRNIAVNGKESAPYSVALSDTGEVYYPAELLNALNTVVEAGDPISVDSQPLAAISTANKKLQVVNVPGSARFNTGERVVPIQDQDAAGNVLSLNAAMKDGVLTDLSGTLSFTTAGVTASLQAIIHDGQVSGAVTIQTADLQITLQDEGGAVSGTLSYHTDSCQFSVTYQQGQSQPASWDLALTVHF